MPDGTTAEITANTTQNANASHDAARVVPGSVDAPPPTDHSRQDGGVAHDSTTLPSQGKSENAMGVVVPAPESLAPTNPEPPIPPGDISSDKQKMEMLRSEVNKTPGNTLDISTDPARREPNVKVHEGFGSGGVKLTPEINPAEQEKISDLHKDITNASPTPFSEHGYSEDVLQAEGAEQHKKGNFFSRLFRNPFSNTQEASTSNTISQPETPSVSSTPEPMTTTEPAQSKPL